MNKRSSILGAALLALLAGAIPAQQQLTGTPVQPYYQEGSAPAGAPGASVLEDMTGSKTRRCFGVTVYNDSATDTLLVTVGNSDLWDDPVTKVVNPDIYNSWLFNGAPFASGTQPANTLSPVAIPPAELIPPVRIPPGEIGYFPTYVRYVALATESGGPIPYRITGAF